MRTIHIQARDTRAHTQYWQISPPDAEYVYVWLNTFLADMSEVATHNSQFRNEWFLPRPEQHPQGRQGANSHASILGGICSARLTNTQRDLSTPQLAVVEFFFELIADYYQDRDPAPDRVRFQQPLISWT